MAARSISRNLCNLRALSSIRISSSEYFRRHSYLSPQMFCTYTREESSSTKNFSLPSSVPFKLFLDHGMDFQHWFVVMHKPDDDMSRQELIDFYIDTLAKVVGSKDEARMMIYSVSTKFYYSFGVKTSMEIAEKLKELPNVKMVELDSYNDLTTKSYGAEPFVNGEAVPYDPKYHETWVTQQMRRESGATYPDEVDTTDYGDEVHNYVNS